MAFILLFFSSILQNLIYNSKYMNPLIEWGQWDLNPRPPAPQAYTFIIKKLVSWTKLDDSPFFNNKVITFIKCRSLFEVRNLKNFYTALIFLNDSIPNNVVIIVEQNNSSKSNSNE